MPPLVKHVEWGVFQAPLSEPYHLSFGTLRSYAGVWVRCERDDGRVGLGEAVPLPGYGSETLADVERVVEELTRGAAGLDLATLAAKCRKAWGNSPFAASAVMSALELPELLDEVDLGQEFPLNLPVAGDAEPESLRARLSAGFSQGYSFIKVKVGRRLDREIANLPIFFREFADQRFRVLFDANQAYSWDEALHFAQALAKQGGSRLCWFEQPLGRDDWDGHERLCAASPCPIILDESIYSAEDVRRAAAMGAHGVKLKLFKQCGPRHCLELADLARSLGLAVVFGNGVATDIGNLIEFFILSRGGNFSSPAESNGFCKLARPVLSTPLAVHDGRLVLSGVTRQELARSIQSFNGRQA